LFILLLALSGLLYQWTAGIYDRHLSPPPGQLVDVGGFRMHINCVGQGTPVVVMDSGVSDSSLSWYKVQPQISKFTNACTYDRAGLGWSDTSPEPRTSRVLAQELHTLLRNAGISMPLVLVGHSMGGYNVRMYASLYRSDVVGMLLVDSSHPEQSKRLPPSNKKSLEEWQRKLQMQQYLMPFGIPRLIGWCGNGTEPLRAALRATQCRVQQPRTTLAETTAFEESAAQVQALGTLGDLPLIVISEDPDKPIPGLTLTDSKVSQQAWDQMQEELARLSSNATRLVALGSGHQIQQEKPDMVVAAIKTLVEQYRKSQSAR
jgi:pimeloyl-ACP methyl ester carboxylesterase